MKNNTIELNKNENILITGNVENKVTSIYKYLNGDEPEYTNYVLTNHLHELCLISLFVNSLLVV